MQLNHVEWSSQCQDVFLGGEKLENLQDQWVGMHISRDAFPPAGVAYKRALKSSLSLSHSPCSNGESAGIGKRGQSATTAGPGQR